MSTLLRVFILLKSVCVVDSSSTASTYHRPLADRPLASLLIVSCAWSVQIVAVFTKALGGELFLNSFHYISLTFYLVRLISHHVQ